MVAVKWIVVALLATGCISKPDKPGGPRVWKQIAGAKQPGLLLSPRLTYDPALESIVLFGGEEDPENGSQSLSNAMWRFDGTQWLQLCDPCLAMPHLMPGFASDGHRFVAVAGVRGTLAQRRISSNIRPVAPQLPASPTNFTPRSSSTARP